MVQKIILFLVKDAGIQTQVMDCTCIVALVCLVSSLLTKFIFIFKNVQNEMKLNVSHPLSNV